MRSSYNHPITILYPSYIEALKSPAFIRFSSIFHPYRLLIQNKAIGRLHILAATSKLITNTWRDSKAQEMMRLRSASVTASVRLVTPSLERILLTWDLMVDGLTISLPAICTLFKPSTIKANTARSRSVRP